MVKDLYEYYKITNEGVIINKFTGRILKTRPNKKGYITASLYVNKKVKLVVVAHEVAKKFLPPSNFKYIKYKDGDKSNIKASNLYWAKDSKF